MKKIIYLIAIVFTFFACNENVEKLSKVEKKIGNLDLGGAIPNTKFSTNKVFNVSDLSSANIAFELEVVATGQYGDYDKVVVRKVYSGNNTDTVLHGEYSASSLPQNISVSAEDALTGFAVTTATVNAGDYVDWIFEVYYADGSQGNYADDALDNSFPNFRSYFSCPTDLSMVAGTYNVTNDPWGAGFSSTVEVEVGPGDNQITLKDIFGHAASGYGSAGDYDVVVDINTATGQATVSTQNSWHTGAAFGLSYGVANVTGGGFVFSCIDKITLDFQHCVSLGCWGGTWNYTLEK